MIQIWYETINNLYSCSPLFCFLSTQTMLFIYNVTTGFWIGPALQKPNSAFSKRPCCIVTQQAVVLIQLHKTPHNIALSKNTQPCYHFPVAPSQFQVDGISKLAFDWAFAYGCIQTPFVTTGIFQVLINLTVVSGKQKSIIS